MNNQLEKEVSSVKNITELFNMDGLSPNAIFINPDQNGNVAEIKFFVLYRRFNKSWGSFRTF